MQARGQSLPVGGTILGFRGWRIGAGAGPSGPVLAFTRLRISRLLESLPKKARPRFFGAARSAYISSMNALILLFWLACGVGGYFLGRLVAKWWYDRG